MQENNMSCPICDNKTSIKFRPFCSKHCADVDLGRWFNGTYTVPDDTDEAKDEALAALNKASDNLH